MDFKVEVELSILIDKVLLFSLGKVCLFHVVIQKDKIFILLIILKKGLNIISMPAVNG